MQNKKFWFTLLELLISISIIAILVVILFRAFNTISEVSFRAQQEKNIQQELIRINQSLQNIADNHSIDFDRYKENSEDKHSSLFLSWESKIEITSTWNCLLDTKIQTGFDQEQIDNPCQLIIIPEDWEIIEISSPSQSIISQPFFTIHPNKANSEIIKNENNPHLQIRQPGFQLNFTIYSPIYQKWNRVKTSKILFQQFFNLKK